MGIARFVELGVLIVFLQAFTVVSSEEPAACVPHFEAGVFNFTVERNRLQPHRILGNVAFDDCTHRTRFPYLSEDKHFTVDTAGTLKVGRRTVALHGGRSFFVHVWDTQGRKWTVPVRVLHRGSEGGHKHNHHGSGHGHGSGHHHHGAEEGQGHGHHHHGAEEGQGHGHHHHGAEVGHGHHHHGAEVGHGHHHHGAEVGHGHHHNGSGHGHGHHHHGTEVGHGHHHNGSGHGHGHHHHDIHPSTELDGTNNAETGAAPAVPVLHFPKALGGLKRRKRAWVIPPISFPENDRGPYPKQMVQIRSDSDSVVTVVYSITGPGAEQPPVGLFTVDRNSGQLYVTQPLDREKQSKYMLQAHAVVAGSGDAEQPMDIIVYVIDQNDNKPIFTETTYIGQVAEASPKGFEVLTVLANDLDEPNNDNSDVRYTLLSQVPALPSGDMFFISPVGGVISVNAQGLDREKFPKYTLEIQAADMRGNGYTGKTQVILTVIDSNDNAPQFEQPDHVATVPENKVGALVAKLAVTDGDDAHTEAWAAKFSIVGGDPDGKFAVVTGPNRQEGIITTAKELDFEMVNKYTLLVAVENEVPFAVQLPTATATVVVTVVDVNEAPVFSPAEKLIVHKENVALGTNLVQYLATDPDTARAQTVTYRILSDVAGWLSVAKDTGVVMVRSEMDRESPFVKDNKYTALIGAIDSDEVPATGTGTLVIKLEDVNDNAPTIDVRLIKVCNRESEPQLLSVTDKDGPGFTSPYSVKLQGPSSANWSATMNDTKTGIILRLNTALPMGKYSVNMRVFDNMNLDQDNIIEAEVCECTGTPVVCKPAGRVAKFGLSAILGVLGGILLLLLLVLLLLMFLRRRGGEKKEPLLQDDDIRDNIYYYDEEGGGEDDQDYDLGVLHRGLDNRPEVFRNDVMPTYPIGPTPYRPRPANPEDIGNFIDDNLKAADNDPTAPPYDSLLVFDYEGGGSDAGSLSSLNSDSSGDQDYDCFSEWGPRFKKLADMYGGGEDDDML